MLVLEITEGYKQIFGRKGGETVRKYRCTSGPRRGRIVSKATTCNAPLSPTKSMKFKAVRARKGASQAQKTRITKRTNAASRRLKGYNVGARRLKKRVSRKRLFKRKKI